jgi:hypothetical protein
MQCSLKGLAEAVGTAVNAEGLIYSEIRVL